MRFTAALVRESFNEVNFYTSQHCSKLSAAASECLEANSMKVDGQSTWKRGSAFTMSSARKQSSGVKHGCVPLGSSTHAATLSPSDSATTSEVLYITQFLHSFVWCELHAVNGPDFSLAETMLMSLASPDLE
jgi:hypothetical protein